LRPIRRYSTRTDGNVARAGRKADAGRVRGGDVAAADAVSALTH
jgi:hypothetical protein